MDSENSNVRVSTKPGQLHPPRLGLSIVECGWRLRACWVFVPRATAANAAAAPQGMCMAPQSGHNKVFKSLCGGTQRNAPRRQRGFKYLRDAGRLGDVGGYAPDLVTNSAGTLLIPVPISPPKMDGIEPFVAGGRRGSGGLAMHGVMRVLIARWLAVIAMLGLLALVIATSRTPCVPYGLWHTLQMNCR